MRHTTLQVTGFILVALTTYVLMEVVWLLWPAAGYFSIMEGSNEGQMIVSDVLSTNRLLLASGEEVRLAALTVPQAGKPFAEEGKQATRALTLNQAVRLVGPLEAAYLYLPDGQLLQILLIEGGYATVADDLPNDEQLSLLREAERKARNANLGVWQGEEVAMSRNFPTAVPTSGPITCEPSLVAGNTIGAEEVAEHQNENVNVVFLPIRTIQRNGSVLLMSGLTEEEFGVLIPAGLASTVEHPELLYLNRCLVVSGRLKGATLSDGIRLVLHDFEQILILR